MAKKTGLGKGLDAIFPVNKEKNEKINENEIEQKIKNKEVEPNQ